MYSIDEVKESIKRIHSNDEIQSNLIFDNSNRIIVEAPAGCGKTKTMISKIAYLIATNQIESTKKVLALTFSVNASYKIKKDIFEQLPTMMGCSESDSLNLSNIVVVSNYHGFCRKTLALYGNILLNQKVNFNTLVAVDDSRSEYLIRDYNISENVAIFLAQFSDAIKRNDKEFVLKNFERYNQYVKDIFIGKGCITYNAIILFTYELFSKHLNIKKFYHKYFPIIFIDEFQDTNCISWLLINEIIDENTKLVFMGDSLQRIYGFIGAVPNLINIAEKELQMKRYTLNINYRFKDNEEMLLLDKNIRLNAEKLNNEKITEISNPIIVVAENQNKEAEWICSKVLEIIKNDKIAILVRAGATNKNTIVIQELLEKCNIDYFFALFNDDDEQYNKFHIICTKEFTYIIQTKKVVTYKVLNTLIERVMNNYTDVNNIIDSLLKLLRIFCDKIFKEYRNLTQEEKIQFIFDTFENKGLRQNMDKVEERVILATIHACKGLEYPYVIIADNEKDSFPTYQGSCEQCYIKNKNKCIKKILNSSENGYIEEMSVFYVGFTRAKKKVFFTMSKKRVTYNGGSIDTKGSCFLKLKGVGIDNVIVYKEGD